MVTKVLDYIKENHMLQPGDRVVVGVSGGADSVCLLFMLLKIREIIPIELAAVHVNHRIRREAAEDAAYVEALCKDWGCSYYYEEADVEKYAKEKHISTEEAGREIRYRVFAQVLEKMGASKGKIAVAHNQNDNAETVLFHLMRGTGLEGMAGIRPVRGRVIRPLLCLSRMEIEDFLAKWGISYCIDRTNQEDTYTRNRIRHHILPYAEKEICERAISHISDASVLMREAAEYISQNAEAAFKRCTRKSAEVKVIFDVAAFLGEPVLLQKQMLLLALEKAAGSRKDLGAVHVEAVKKLFERSGNGQCDLPYGLRAYREYGEVRIEKEGLGAERGAGLGEPLMHEMKIPGKTCLPDGRVLECTVFPYEKSKIIPQKTYTKWFDYDRIGETLVLRNRQPGDYLETYRDGGRKTLKAYLIDEKIPKAERGQVPVLAEGKHILWVIGMRISEHYKINEKTKTVLQIQVTGGTSDGRKDQNTVDRG